MVVLLYADDILPHSQIHTPSDYLLLQQNIKTISGVARILEMGGQTRKQSRRDVPKKLEPEATPID